MIDDEFTTDTNLHPSGRCWSVRDWRTGMEEAWRIEEKPAAQILWEHAPHTRHCGDYDVYAWPCTKAAGVLNKLLGGGRGRPETRVSNPRESLRDEIAKTLHKLLCDGRHDDTDGPCWGAWRPEADLVMLPVEVALAETWERGHRGCRCGRPARCHNPFSRGGVA